ncbi:MAG: chromate efflux transporter [Verrucomicrobiota bacterium]
MNRVPEVFFVFLRLGLTSFGGPVAHLAFFHEAFVKKLKWLDEETYSDTLALCQFLPGPGSSQLGFAIGYLRAGIPGAFAAFIAFTLPSAALMIGFGMGMLHFAPNADAPWLQGLKIAVVVVVAKAVWGMARQLCPDRSRITLAIACAIAMLALGTAWAQVMVIVGGGVLGAFLFRQTDAVTPATTETGKTPSRAKSGFWLVLFFVILIGLPPVATFFGWEEATFFSGFFQAGSLVFGGGHVVLPLLRDFVVPNGWMTDDTFMAGYGAVQAMPGPLFTISAFLGTVAQNAPFGGIEGGVVALIAIFVPSWLLVLGALPFWQRMRGNSVFAASLRGANAAVVGILVAALYQPVWIAGIREPQHFIIGLILFCLVMFWKLPPWASVIVAAGLGYVFLGFA